MDIPEIGSNFPNKNEDKFNQVLSSSKEGGGLLASIGLKKDDVNKDDSVVEDSQEEDPHKKSDLFDTSKDRIGGVNAANSALKGAGAQSDEEGLDLGFGLSKKDKDGAQDTANKSGAGEFDDYGKEMEGMSDDDGPMTEEHQKAIDE